MDMPFISFCMTSHNQREYAILALKAALAQDYPNMEIIVADDASTDGSAEALMKIAEESRRANVRILTSERNLGNIGNFERLFLAARGEFIIEADGDDISEPNRASRIVEEWTKGGKKATLVIHGGVKIDLKGRAVGVVGTRSADAPLGACMAYSPRVVRDFPRATVLGCAQDHVFARRAVWMGEVLTMPDRLVRYRVGSGVSSIMYNRRATERRMAHIRAAGCRQSLVDLDYCVARGMIDGARAPAIRRQCEIGAEQNDALVALIEKSSLRERWRAYKTLYPRGMKDRAGWLRLPYLLPFNLGLPLYFAYDGAKAVFRMFKARFGKGR